MDQENKKQPEHRAEEEREEERSREPAREGGTDEARSGADNVPYMERFYELPPGETVVVKKEDIAPRPEPVTEVSEALEVLEPGVIELSQEELAVTAVREETILEHVEAQEIGMTDEELSGALEDLCLSKAEEFRMLGYEHVTGKDIWDCVSDKYKKTGVPPLHKIVNDILSLKTTGFMNWMTMSIYKDAR